MSNARVSPALIERLVAIAEKAGRETLRYYGCNTTAHDKADGTPVTAADRAAHAYIEAELRDIDSGIPVVSEEGELAPYDERAGWRRFWLVDPLDGTKEFIGGNGEFTVNIALVEDGQPTAGVIAAPALDCVYFAGRGEGAWRRTAGARAERIHSTGEAPEVTRVVESRSHPSAELESFIASLGPTIRIKLGSSLKFCRLAEGAADVYPRFGRTMEWDVAAGDCIFRNSGPDGSERQSPFAYNTVSLSTARFVIGANGPSGSTRSA